MIVWNCQSTPPELWSMLRTIGEEYAVAEGENPNIEFSRTDRPDELSVQKNGSQFTVLYGKNSAAARGLGFALAGKECGESVWFDTFGVLLDCSRTGVVTVEHFRHWLRRMALFGYNMAMLYTKDAYQLPGEPYFGYMRGAYSLEEMRAVDAYAKKLGIEMVASIQALGHLEPQLRWPAYAKICDTNTVMLVDEPETYRLIDKMLTFWSQAFDSRRIHLGMDETFDLGRGRFLDQHGWERPFDIYNRHLAKVNRLCEKYKFKPIIWSDMYFSFAAKNRDCYARDAHVPEDVKAAIPKNVQLSYWDYYHRTEDIYLEKLREQSTFNRTAPFMASGIWTWQQFWYDFEQTEATVAPCIEACRKTGVREIVFTLWGDDGGYCEFDSAFAGMAWCAAYANNRGNADAKYVAPLFRAVCSADYQIQILAGKMKRVIGPVGSDIPPIYPAPVMWDDPLMGMIWHEYEHYLKTVWPDTLEYWKTLRDELEPARGDRAAGRIDHAWNVLNVLVKKVEFRCALLNAYATRDHAELQTLSRKAIPDLLDAIHSFSDSFRSQWIRSFKPYGLEIMQIRMAGLAERYRETGRRIDALLNGESADIEELDQNIDAIGSIDMRYRMTATAGWFI